MERDRMPEYLQSMPTKHTGRSSPGFVPGHSDGGVPISPASDLKEAVTEIKKVARTDPVTAGDGVVTLMERIWPAFQDIDTSSGALGGAVYWAQDELLPIADRGSRRPKDPRQVAGPPLAGNRG